FTGGVFAGTTQFVHYTGEVGKSSIDKIIVVTGGVVDELVKGIQGRKAVPRPARSAALVTALQIAPCAKRRGSGFEKNRCLRAFGRFMLAQLPLIGWKRVVNV
ncbi:MAG: hypothetical protein PHE10_03695, partial [Kiritimatiellae bacterium]|nr:hypothetical protein [Kiritimatiellia bacterium]